MLNDRPDSAPGLPVLDILLIDNGQFDLSAACFDKPLECCSVKADSTCQFQQGRLLGASCSWMGSTGSSPIGTAPGADFVLDDIVRALKHMWKEKQLHRDKFLKHRVLGPRSQKLGAPDIATGSKGHY